jgi:hypothetical protein
MSNLTPSLRAQRSNLEMPQQETFWIASALRPSQ